MISSKNMAAEARELLIHQTIDFVIGDAAYDNRVYPPPSGDWYLAGFRWGLVVAVGASASPALDMKDASGNAIITQISLPGVQAIDTRGSATITGTDAQRTIHAQGGNAYHALVPGGTGTNGAAGRIHVWLSYRRVQPSGDLSKARLA